MSRACLVHKYFGGLVMIHEIRNRALELTATVRIGGERIPKDRCFHRRSKIMGATGSSNKS